MKTNSILGLYIGTAFVFFALQFALTAPYLSNGALFTTALLAASVIQDSRVKLLSKKSLSTNLLLLATLVGAVFSGSFIYYADTGQTPKIIAGAVFLLSLVLYLKNKPRRPRKKFKWEQKPTEADQAQPNANQTKENDLQLDANQAEENKAQLDTSQPKANQPLTED